MHFRMCRYVPNHMSWASWEGEGIDETRSIVAVPECPRTSLRSVCRGQLGASKKPIQRLVLVVSFTRCRLVGSIHSPSATPNGQSCVD